MIDRFNIFIAGVGGQGVIFASNIIANAAIKAGLKARIGQTFTAAQRGGSVSAHVRIGEKVHAPLMGRGDADVLLGFEPIEAVRYEEYLKKNGIVVINTHSILPRSSLLGQQPYPRLNEIEEYLRKRTNQIIKVNATEIAHSIGLPIAMNLVMLGVLSSIKGLKSTKPGVR